MKADRYIEKIVRGYREAIARGEELGPFARLKLRRYEEHLQNVARKEADHRTKRDNTPDTLASSKRGLSRMEQGVSEVIEGIERPTTLMGRACVWVTLRSPEGDMVSESILFRDDTDDV